MSWPINFPFPLSPYAIFSTHSNLSNSFKSNKLIRIFSIERKKKKRLTLIQPTKLLSFSIKLIKYSLTIIDMYSSFFLGFEVGIDLILPLALKRRSVYQIYFLMRLECLETTSLSILLKLTFQNY